MQINVEHPTLGPVNAHVHFSKYKGRARCIEQYRAFGNSWLIEQTDVDTEVMSPKVILYVYDRNGFGEYAARILTDLTREPSTEDLITLLAFMGPQLCREKPRK